MDRFFDPASLPSCNRELIRIRADHPALRASPGELVLVILNLGEESVSEYDLTLERLNETQRRCVSTLSPLWVSAVSSGQTL